MPRNGSGSFSLPSNSWNPPVNGASATPADFAALSEDIATALTGSVAADGQTPMTGNLDMGNNRVTSVAAATARTDAIQTGQAQDGTFTYLTGTAGTNTITASVTGLAAYAAGQEFRFVAAGANTGAVTLNVNSVGAKAITKNGTVALSGGEIISGQTVCVVYDGTQFQLVNNPRLTNGTSQATTSGTSIDFTSIPSWVKRITVCFVGVSVNGTSNPLIQIGDSGGIEATGYLGAGAGGANAATPGVTAYITGFGINSADAANVLHGTVTLTLVNAATYTWVASGVLSNSQTAAWVTVSGSKNLSAVLDRVRITTVGGVNTFDAGSINILYE